MSIVLTDAPTSTAEVYAFLETHFYDGGLRFQSLPRDLPRPDWAPAPDRVGFRDEFPLLDGDHVVELSWHRSGASVVTWLGVYRKSVDRTFGDRKNHAGAGLWLRDRQLLDSHGALQGLDQFAEAVASAGTDVTQLSDGADQFLSDFMPSRLADAGSFPTGLCRMPGPSALSGQQRFFVAHASELDAAWKLAAEQVDALCYLASDGEELSRALILVSTQDPAGREFPRGVPEPVAPTSWTTLLKRLPEVCADLAARERSDAARLAALSSERERLAAALGTSEQNGRDLSAKVEALETQIANSETLRAYARVEKELGETRRTFADLRASLNSLDVRLDRALSRVPSGRSETTRVQSSPPARLESRRDSPPVTHMPGWIIVALVGSFVLLLFAGVAYYRGWFSSPAPTERRLTVSPAPDPTTVEPPAAASYPPPRPSDPAYDGVSAADPPSFEIVNRP